MHHRRGHRSHPSRLAAALGAPARRARARARAGGATHTGTGAWTARGWAEPARGRASRPFGRVGAGSTRVNPSMGLTVPPGASGVDLIKIGSIFRHREATGSIRSRHREATAPPCHLFSRHPEATIARAEAPSSMARRAIGVNDAPADSAPIRPIGSGPTRWAALAELEVPRGYEVTASGPAGDRRKRRAGRFHANRQWSDEVGGTGRGAVGCSLSTHPTT